MISLHILPFVVALSTISVVTMILWTACYPVYMLLDLLGMSSTAPRSQQIGSLAHRFGASWLLWMCGVKVHMSEANRKKIAPFADQNVVYAMNHQSNLDPFLLSDALPANLRFVYKKELGYVPLLGCALFMCGHVAVDRGDRSKAISSMAAAERFLQLPVNKGGSVGISPEGTRSRTGELQLPFKKGPFHVARNAGVTIVPVVLRGAHSILPAGSMSLRPGVVSARVLDPIRSADFDDVDQMREHCERLFQEGSRAEAWSQEELGNAATDLPVTATWLWPVVLAGSIAALVYYLAFAK